MLILAIETSCDETGIALVEANGGFRSPKFKVIKNLIASQIETHRPYGGVVPNLAKREHLTNLPILFNKLNPKPYTLYPDLIAVTVGPGLEPCLWTGINFAQEIKKTQFSKAKVIGTNHLHGHLYSFLLKPKTWNLEPKKIFPAVQLLVSGGHTILVLMESLTKYKKLGETRDDAAGEAFDKVARMLSLPYPGGPEIEKFASQTNPTIEFPRPMINSKNYDFSFSGLKTAVLYHIKDKDGTKEQRSEFSHKQKSQVTASFQQATIDVLTEKTLRAAEEFKAKSVILSGGVAANKALQKELKKQTKKIGAHFITAPAKYHGDNAAMIAAAGYITHLQEQKHPLKANGNLTI